MIKSLITDPGTGIQAEIDDDNDSHALVVATRPLKSYKNVLRFFINDDYGVDMNQNALPGGTPEKIHDGTDSSLWTATDIVGGAKTTFNSTDQAQAGTKSIKVDNSPVNDVFQLAKGSDLDCNGYISITMYIYPDKDWKAGDTIELYGWDTGTGLQVGDAIDLSDYFTYNQYDVWHKLTIPLADMGDLSGYTTLDALRIRIVTKEGKSAKFYIDTFQFEEKTGTTEPIAFHLKPDLGTWLHVNSFQILLADEYDSTVSNGTMPGIPYNSLLGVAKLATGITYKRITDNEVISSASIHQFLDFMAFSNATITGSGSDGTNTWVSVNMQFTEPVILKEEDADEMSLTVNDDLSGLLVLRVGAGSKIEQRL
jgi:hypothetical protein